jgi:hypothetical protein
MLNLLICYWRSQERLNVKRKKKKELATGKADEVTDKLDNSDPGADGLFDIITNSIRETDKDLSTPLVSLNTNEKSVKKTEPYHYTSWSGMSDVYPESALKRPFSTEEAKKVLSAIGKSGKTLPMNYKPELTQPIEKIESIYRNGFPDGKPLRGLKQCLDCGTIWDRVSFKNSFFF